ncbi:hypothetical protein Tsubulata_017180 [Turnera subulata]|uniref:Uncharacterized protein n=1 Tax=Turnera subulata TaxID=218843 RepID=A0A9Q0GHV2_9ROSI|nr:hypothetical protein Tsubulata_017180 [Turnera subulata]
MASSEATSLIFSKLTLNLHRSIDTEQALKALKILKSHRKDGKDSDKQSTADMSAFVQNLLQQMNSCFLDFPALDEMGNRINELEESINELRVEMGVEGTPSSPLQKPGEGKHGEGST